MRPSVTGSLARPEPAAATNASGDASFDMTQRLGSNLLASVTVNTDFAETEVDARQTNLTRLPLFFPEKRTFFLEGAETFTFGLGLGRDLLPFHSRRIGLLEGQEVPIVAGVKLDGVMGRTNIGALAVRTRNASDVAPASTLGAVRLRQDVLAESSVGMIATAGDPQGRADRYTAGADFTYQTSSFRGNKNFLVGIWGLITNRQGLVGDRTAAGIKIDYPNDDLDVALTYRRVGESFEPSLGFVPRTGIHDLGVSGNFRHRPSRRVFRYMLYQFRPSIVFDLDGRWESYQVFLAPVNWRFESGDRFEFNLVPTGERLVEPFELADGVVVPPGSYDFARWRLEAELASDRKLSGQITWWFGSFYDGSLHEIEIESTWNPSPLLTLDLELTRNVGALRAGRFTTDLIGSRLRLNVSPDLGLAGFVQYDTDSRTIGSNTRLRWTFHPLGDLFIVYNHNLEDRLDRWAFESNQLLVKLQYAMRY